MIAQIYLHEMWGNVWFEEKYICLYKGGTILANIFPARRFTKVTQTDRNVIIKIELSI